MTPDQAAEILLAEAATQPVPLHAAGFRMTIHACGAAVWVRADERGIFWCDLMSGDRHACGGLQTPQERDTAMKKHERARWVPSRKPAPVPAYGTFEL